MPSLSIEDHSQQGVQGRPGVGRARHRPHERHHDAAALDRPALPLARQRRRGSVRRARRPGRDALPPGWPRSTALCCMPATSSSPVPAANTWPTRKARRASSSSSAKARCDDRRAGAGPGPCGAACRKAAADPRPNASSGGRRLCSAPSTGGGLRRAADAALAVAVARRSGARRHLPLMLNQSWS